MVNKNKHSHDRVTSGHDELQFWTHRHDATMALHLASLKFGCMVGGRARAGATSAQLCEHRPTVTGIDDHARRHVTWLACPSPRRANYCHRAEAMSKPGDNAAVLVTHDFCRSAGTTTARARFCW